MTMEPCHRIGDASLTAIRRQIEALAVPDGRFRVTCAVRGERPVPVDGLTFPDRETAVGCARLATLYRAHLRHRDERTRLYDLVVHEDEPRVTMPSVSDRGDAADAETLL